MTVSPESLDAIARAHDRRLPPPVSEGERSLAAPASAGTPPGPVRRTEWPALPAVEAFHGLAGDFVRLVEPHTEADPAALLVGMLVAFGNVIGRGPGFTADGSFHATNLFAATVGDSASARKGTAWAHVARLYELAAPEWASGEARRVLGGLSSGEGLVYAVRDPRYKRRRAKKDEKGRADEDGYVTDLEDEGVRDKRALIREGELAGPLKVMAREGNTLSILLRNLWDGGDAGSLTKNDPTRTTGALVSIVADITAHELRRELTATDLANGFANRFLFVCARRSKLLPHGGNVPADKLAELAAKLRERIDFAERVRELHRDAAANARWEQEYERLTTRPPGLYGAVTARGAPLVMRLATLYALLDGSVVIRREHLDAGLALWGYCDRSARHIFGAALGHDLADKLLAELRGAGDAGLSRSQLREAIGGRIAAAQIEAALGLLVDHKLARCDTENTGGRPVQRWWTVEETEQSPPAPPPSGVSYVSSTPTEDETGQGAPPGATERTPVDTGETGRAPAGRAKTRQLARLGGNGAAMALDFSRGAVNADAEADALHDRLAAAGLAPEWID